MERRLAAILAADVVGYSRLMERDEAGTLAALRSRRAEILQPTISRHRGRIVKVMGDGALVEFASAVNAVQCAVDLQNAMAAANADLPQDSRILLRVGINLGDVMVEGSDLYGDGVNIAARLEALAEAGGIVVSQTVFDHVRGKVKLGFDDLGDRQLKNITVPVRVYRVLADGQTMSPRPPLALPDKPSIAVLPFRNMSGESEQEYFADGMVDEITTALSRFRGLFVIARNSSFAYKDRSMDIKQVGRELGVRYVLEGSVRKAAGRLRITGQLIDASSGANLWADHFEGALSEVFQLQDQVATSVVGAITPRLEGAEIERAKRKPTESLDAYDYYLRGLAMVDRLSNEGITAALQLFSKAIEQDPDFALAYARAALCHMTRNANGWVQDRAREIAEATRLARRGVELGRDDAVALSYGGYVLAYIAGELDDGAAFVDRALALNPNLAAAWGFSGWLKTCLGDFETGLKHAAMAIRLSPFDSRTYAWQHYMGLAHFCAASYDEAALWAENALRSQPNFAAAMRTLAASRALAGRMAEAEKAMTRLRQFVPELRLSRLDEVMPPFRRADDRSRYLEGLRRAGLPE